MSLLGWCVMSIRDTSKNKGEWAELYVLLKLLGEGGLYAADRQLRKKNDSYLDILRILREEIQGQISEYSREGKPGMVQVYVGGRMAAQIRATEFLDRANSLFRYLSETSGRAFKATDELADFADKARIRKVKSPSVRNVQGFGGKSDIVIKLRDARNSLVSTMGFSIKAHVGSPPTLFNVSQGSRIEFELPGMTDEQIHEFNSLRDERGHRNWSECIAFLSRRGIRPEYRGYFSSVFEDNLVLIRESMPRILAWMYKESLLVDRSCKEIPKLCGRLKTRNPLGLSRSDVYEKAIKDFLFAAFSGMTASRRWDGQEQVNGGYIVVKDDGEVLCYHANDREEFRDYLFRETYIEYVSCSKHKWGNAYRRNDGKACLMLNASIRFNKK